MVISMTNSVENVALVSSFPYIVLASPVYNLEHTSFLYAHNKTSVSEMIKMKLTIGRAIFYF